MGILFGLLTALTWGSSDFLTRYATQRIGTLRAMLYMQLFGFLFLTIFLFSTGGWGHLSDGSGWQPWAWGLLAGGLNALSNLALYRSFEIGKISVVAPVSASYPALTLALSWLTGERLTAVRAVGIVLTLLGVAFVAGGEKPPSENDEEGKKRSGKGVGWALCAAVCFGFLFWLLGIRIVPRVGATQTVWIIRMTSMIVASAVIFLAKQPIKLPFDTSFWLVMGMGVLDTSAFVLSNHGMQMEQIAVVSVLGSLYGAVTVGLAAIFLREKVSRLQWAGIVTVFAGIILIGR